MGPRSRYRVEGCSRPSEGNGPSEGLVRDGLTEEDRCGLPQISDWARDVLAEPHKYSDQDLHWAEIEQRAVLDSINQAKRLKAGERINLDQRGESE